LSAVDPAGLGGLPDFELCRRQAHALLGDAQDDLRYWNRGSGLTTGQSNAVARARRLISAARLALDDAAR